MFQITEQSWITHGVTLALGALLTAACTTLRNRTRKMTYRVNHEHVALSTEDAIFGNVQATWQGRPVTNLYTSTVTLENTSTVDYQKMEFQVYTGSETLLLGQYTELVGKPVIIHFTDEYKASLNVPAGQHPTPQQWETYNHRRNYILPVFNRGQKAVIRYLTTVPGGGSPSVWLDISHPGVTAKYLPNVPEVCGVPLAYALSVGFFVCIFFYVLSGLMFNPWTAGLVCLFAGALCRIIGAVVYKTSAFVFRLFFK